MGTSLPYVLAFCRIAVGLIFAVSFGGKVLDIPAFTQAIGRFHILPERTNQLAALLFLSGELTVIVLMILGGRLLEPGFGLAIFLLLTFCMALVSALVKRVSISCNCFGPNEKPVSLYDVWRNVGFILCALGGWGTLVVVSPVRGGLGVMDWVLVAPPAAAFVAIWTQIESIVRLFRQR